MPATPLCRPAERGGASGGDTATVGVLGLHNSTETAAVHTGVEPLGHEPVRLRRRKGTVRVAGRSHVDYPCCSGGTCSNATTWT